MNTLMSLILFSVVSAAMSMPASNAASVSVPLVTFDGNPATSFNFTEHNAGNGGGPVVSKGTWAVTDGHGVLDGDIGIEWDGSPEEDHVGWPGFIRATLEGDLPDASTASTGALILMVRSNTPTYNGFRVSIGTTEHWSTTKEACGPKLGPEKNRGCYLARFTVPPSRQFDDFTPVRIPFSSFSGSWLFGPGNIRHTCAASKEMCLTSKALARIKSLDFWATGVEGKVRLEVKSITASA